jgi:hypothetical protein
MAEVGWTCFSDPGRWLRHQCMGWRADENGEYHGVWRRLQKAEFRKLFQGTDLDIEEVDEAIGTIAFVSELSCSLAFRYNNPRYTLTWVCVILLCRLMH